jgi:group I intron endonuclease
VDLGRRFIEYFSSKHLQEVLGRSESLIYRALLKHGYSSFKLEILEYCKPKECLTKEQSYLDKLPLAYFFHSFPSSEGKERKKLGGARVQHIRNSWF